MAEFSFIILYLLTMTSSGPFSVQEGMLKAVTAATNESNLAYFVLAFNGLIIVTAVYFIARLLHQEFEVFTRE